MPNNRYTKELLEPIIKQSTSWSQVCRAVGIKPATGAQTHLTKRAKSLGLVSDHFKGSAWNKGDTLGPKRALQDYLVKSSYSKSHYLRNRLIKEGLKEDKCEVCGLSSWLGGKIPLELHHINKDHFDNRIDNLQIVCCNCHTLKHRAVVELEDTSHLGCDALIGMQVRPLSARPICIDCKTSISKKAIRCKSCATKFKAVRKIAWPSKQDLLDRLKTVPFTTLAKELGVSDNAIRKHLKSS